MLVYESPGWEWMENIRTDTFQPKIFRLKMEKIKIDYRHQWRPFIGYYNPNATVHWMMIRLLSTQH